MTATDEDRRTEPAWLTIERSFLGAVLIGGGFREVEHLVASEDFERPAHQLIWDAMGVVASESTRVEALSVMNALLSRQVLLQAGGAPYLQELSAAAPTGSNVAFYARQVQQQASTRRLRELGLWLESSAILGVDTRRLESEARVKLADVHARASVTASRVGDLMSEFLEELGRPEDPATARGIKWPYRDVNEKVLPLRTGQLVYIGARPGQGKSVACLDIARSAAIHNGKRVVLHSLEMSKTEVMTRLVAAETGISMDRMNRKQMVESDWSKIAKAFERIDKADLFVDDRPQVGTADIRASVRSYSADLAVVDYLGLMLAPIHKNGNRREAVEANSRELKIIAKEEGIPLVVASQLNRASTQRTDKTPDMSDLRESGGLEQDADVIVLLHREDYYEKESIRAGEVDWIVAKQRAGETGTIPLAARLHVASFADLGA